MATDNEDVKRSASEASGHTNNGTNPALLSIPDVNFDEMNFEQRRAPYNSGKRNSAERKYDKRDNEEDAGPARDGL